MKAFREKKNQQKKAIVKDRGETGILEATSNSVSKRR